MTKNFIKYETDWLGSSPVFYNEFTGKVSHNINDVIDFANIEFHPEGLNNYLDFGFSVFEQTPIKYVKFLRFSSILSTKNNSQFEVIEMDDPVSNMIGIQTHEDDAWDRISNLINNWENSFEDNIIIPTSGGYDSRILNFFVTEKKRIRSFSYGISTNQFDSFEVIYAKKLSEILGINWQQIFIGEFHSYFKEWDKLFGISTHSHGMYHIEFYKKIRSLLKSNYHLLSGLNIDSWSGTRIQNELENLQIFKFSDDNLPFLGLTHRMHSDSKQSIFRPKYFLREKFLDTYKYELSDYQWTSILKTRLKSPLMTYLLRVPNDFGFITFAPGNDFNLAMSILNLPYEKRKDRIWQKKYFINNGLYIESLGLKANFANTLNLEAMDLVPLTPLNIKILSELIHPEYIKWINDNIQPRSKLQKTSTNFYQKTKVGLENVRGRYYIDKVIGKGYRKWNENRLKAYFAYLTIKPIELLLVKRNFFQGKEK